MIHWMCTFFVDWHYMLVLETIILLVIVFGHCGITIKFNLEFGRFGKLIFCSILIVVLILFGFLYEQINSNDALLNESAIQTNETTTYDVNSCEADRVFYDMNGQNKFFGYSRLTFFEEKQSEPFKQVGLFGEEDNSNFVNFILIVKDENSGDMKITSTKTRIKREGMINVLWFHIFYTDNLLHNELEKNEMHVSPSFYEELKEFQSISYLPSE